MASSSTVAPLSSHLKRLGTETAYAVSGECAALAATGKRIYPFHIGDMNFKTPEVLREATLAAIDAGKTGYCPAAGVMPLRQAMAEHITKSHGGVQYTADNVSIQPGGKPVIQKFLASVLEPGDDVLYPAPGYPIYESQVEFLGGNSRRYTFHETDKGYCMDMDDFRSQISDRTKVVIFNNYHNPTGVAVSREDMAEIARLCVQYNVWCLADEAYWDIVYEGSERRSIVTEPGMAERTVILFTFSKSWAMTGWRLGAAVGPEHVVSAISKLTTNQEACTCHFVQYAGIAALTDPRADAFLKGEIMPALVARRDAMMTLVNKIPGFVAQTPASTFYLWVHVGGAMDRLGIKSLEEFRKRLLHDTGVGVCTREHFGKVAEQEKDPRYIRFAFSGISVEDATAGLTLLKQYMDSQFAAPAGA